MNIEKFIKKLRRAADALDELYIDDSSENRKVAQVEILEDKKKRKKKHWTQTPEGKLKMAKIIKAAWRKKKNNET